MPIVLKIILVFTGVLFLGGCVNNIPYPINIIAVICVIAGGVHIATKKNVKKVKKDV